MSNIVLVAIYAALVAGAPLPKAELPSLSGGLEVPTVTFPSGGLSFSIPTPGSSSGSGFGLVGSTPYNTCSASL